MKQRSTTPVSKSFAARLSVIAVTILALAIAPFTSLQVTHADSYDDRIASLQREISSYESSAQQLAGKADTLQRQLNRISAEKATLQAKINLSEAKFKKLTLEIKETEKKITENKDALGETLVDLWAEGDTSALEMLASSKNIGDFIDKQAYQKNLRDSLGERIKEIETLKEKLENDKKQVEKVLAEQKGQRRSLANKEAEQQRLIAQTKGKESAYRNLVRGSQKQISQLRAQQEAAAAIYRSGNGIATNSPAGSSIVYQNFNGEFSCGGGYSYCSYGHDAYVGDRWGLGLARECVHYTADFLERNGYYIPDGAFGNARGSAYQWIGTTTSGGFARLVSDPKYGDIVYMPIGSVGHVGVVEQNYGNGWVKVSQYNFGVTGLYSTMDLKITSGIQFMRFNK